MWKRVIWRSPVFVLDVDLFRGCLSVEVTIDALLMGEKMSSEFFIKNCPFSSPGLSWVDWVRWRSRAKLFWVDNIN